MTFLRRSAAVILAIAATVSLAACAPEADPAPSATVPGGDATGQRDPDAEPTCTTIIPETLVDDFTEYGFAAIEEPFAFGDPTTTTVPGGISCKWGNPDVPTDHGVQIYGWAPLDGGGEEKWTAFLADQGWKKSEEGGLTAYSDPFAEGGMTYAFGDGYVILADTTDGLALVSFP